MIILRGGSHPPLSLVFSVVFVSNFFQIFHFKETLVFLISRKKKTLRRYIKYTHCFALLLLLLLFGRGGGIRNVIIK